MFPTYLVGIPLTRVEWGGGRDEKAMRVDPNVTPSSSRCTRGAPGDDTDPRWFGFVQPLLPYHRMPHWPLTWPEQAVGDLSVQPWVGAGTTPAPGWHASSRTFERHSKHLADNPNEVQQPLRCRKLPGVEIHPPTLIMIMFKIKSWNGKFVMLVQNTEVYVIQLQW